MPVSARLNRTILSCGASSAVLAALIIAAPGYALQATGAAGGQAFGTHIAGEGLRLPPLRMYENYRVNDDLLRIIVANTPGGTPAPSQPVRGDRRTRT